MNPRRILPVCLSLLLMLLLMARTPAIAQEVNARISGIITDPSKAVITGVNVVAVNVDTSVRFATKSNGSGVYVFSSLPVGDYRVEVEHVGFKSIVEPGITLHVQDALELNFEMAVGSAAETVTVNGNSVNANTNDGTVSTVIDRDFIENMPLNGNSLSTLFELTPGTVTNVGGAPGNGGGISVNGQRPTSNYLSVDGAGANVYLTPISSGAGNVSGSGIPVSASGGTNGLLPTDAVEEYRMQTSTYSAEYGRTPGGQIGIKTRGGTNQFQGSLFENFRNQVLDATDWFVGYDKAQPSPLRMNDFGGTFGGPIRKNGLFFFVSHETLILDVPGQSTKADVPSAATRAAASSYFQPYLAVYPLGNMVASASCSSADPYCDPNDPGSDVYSYAPSQYVKDHSTSLRLDGSLPRNIHGFVRISDAPSDQIVEHTYNPYVVSTHIWTATGGLTIPMRPNLLDEFTLGYAHNKAGSSAFIASIGGNDIAGFQTAVAAISNPATASVHFGAPILNWSTLQSGPTQLNNLGSWNVVDTLTWTARRHIIKSGVDYLHRNLVLQPWGQYIGIQTGKKGLAQVNAGTISTLNYDQYYSNPNIGFDNISLFANDDWHITNALTLSYGARWEINPPPVGQGQSVLSITGDISSLNSVAIAPAGTAAYKTVWSNVAPRFGFAYRLHDSASHETVIRGGTGIFFDTGNADSVASAAALTYPFEGTSSQSTVQYSSVNWGGLSTPSPTLPQAYLYANDPNLKAPRTYQWSLSVEQSLASSTILSTTYTGNDGQKLANSIQLFNFQTQSTALLQPYGYITILTNGADSNYQSLQMQFRSHINRRLDALASWTWAHSIVTGNSDFDTSSSIAQYSRRADSSSDIRHIFAASVHYSPQGATGNAFAKALTEGWSFDSIALLQTASPFSVRAPITQIETIEESYGEFNGLANIVPNVPVILHDPSSPGGKRLNAAAFSAPTTPTNGNSPQNGYRMFGLTQWDLSASRTWALMERLDFSLRVSAFNILNIPNFTNVNNIYQSSNLLTFGQAQATYAGGNGSSTNSAYGSLNAAFQNGGARDLQIAAKLRF